MSAILKNVPKTWLLVLLGTNPKRSAKQHKPMTSWAPRSGFAPKPGRREHKEYGSKKGDIAKIHSSVTLNLVQRNLHQHRLTWVLPLTDWMPALSTWSLIHYQAFYWNCETPKTHYPVCIWSKELDDLFFKLPKMQNHPKSLPNMETGGNWGESLTR